MAMATPAAAESEIRRFTAEEVLRMLEVGILTEDDPVELIDGALRLMTPQGPGHGNTVERLTWRLGREYGGSRSVRVQLPLGGGAYDLPEPDVAVCPADGPWHAEVRHPRCDEADLVIEVVVTTRRDADRKSASYARAGAPVLWIVDVPARTVTVHDEPRGDGGWGRVTIVDHDGEVTLPETGRRIAVRAIMPPTTAD